MSATEERIEAMATEIHRYACDVDGIAAIIRKHLVPSLAPDPQQGIEGVRLWGYDFDSGRSIFAAFREVEVGDGLDAFINQSDGVKECDGVVRTSEKMDLTHDPRYAWVYESPTREAVIEARDRIRQERSAAEAKAKPVPEAGGEGDLRWLDESLVTVGGRPAPKLQRHSGGQWRDVPTITATVEAR
jgi:hypothetical protein